MIWFGKAQSESDFWAMWKQSLLHTQLQMQTHTRTRTHTHTHTHMCTHTHTHTQSHNTWNGNVFQKDLMYRQFKLSTFSHPTKFKILHITISLRSMSSDMLTFKSLPVPAKPVGGLFSCFQTVVLAVHFQQVSFTVCSVTNIFFGNYFLLQQQ